MASVTHRITFPPRHFNTTPCPQIFAYKMARTHILGGSWTEEETN